MNQIEVPDILISRDMLSYWTAYVYWVFLAINKKVINYLNEFLPLHMFVMDTSSIGLVATMVIKTEVSKLFCDMVSCLIIS